MPHNIKKLQDKLSEHNIVFLFVGVILLICGAASDITINAYSIKILNPYWQIVIAITGIFLICIGIYLTFNKSSIIRDVNDSKKISSEIDFLNAYLVFIKPDINLSDRYIDIINKHFNQLSTEVKRLNDNENWDALLSVKQRLREYFEYSGRYNDGVKFGKWYISALEKLGKKEEEIWTKIKHVGYLLILAEQHEPARKLINGAIEELATLKISEAVYECYFYGYRYLGISYQRDIISGNIILAKKYFEKAGEIIKHFDRNEFKQKELQARLLGNIGNIAFSEGNFLDALNSYKKSQYLFKDVDDQEHIGIAKLQMAQTLIASEANIEDAPALLNDAHLIFIEIGWLEGEARIAEQYARYYEFKAMKCHSDGKKYIEQALSSANQGFQLFKRIGLERAAGRVEELKYHIETFLKSNY